MRKSIFLALQLTICTLSFCQGLRFQQFGTCIPARPDLDVHWNASEDALPPQIWTYRVLGRRLSPVVVAYIKALCAFTDKDIIDSSSDGVVFKTPDNSRRLWVSFASGSVRYERATKYSQADSVKDVPDEKEALKLVKQMLPNLGISLSGVAPDDKTLRPRFICFGSEVMYTVKSESFTNTYSRTVRFSRAIDGISLIGLDTGGSCEIDFGDHGKIIKIDLSWRNMERVKSYPTLSAAGMIHALRQGKAVQGYLSMNSRGIDWRTAKSVTVNHVWPRYYAGTSEHPSDMLEPFAVLDSSVDTGNGIVNVEIDCPIIDETAP